MNHTHCSRRGFLALGGGIALSGCIGGSGRDGTAGGSGDEFGSVTLLLNWNMSGLHVPYVAARENGFYEEEGFADVEIENGDGADFAANQAGLGNVEFAISSADQILAVNAEELSPVSVGIVMQRNPNVVFADRNSFGRLDDPERLEGATVGSGPGMVRTMTEAFLDHHGVLDGVEYVDTGFDTVQQVLNGDVDAAGGVFSDVVDAEHQGGEIDVLEIESAVASYGHLVATDRRFAERNADAVSGFLRATARGTAWAAENPDEAIDHLVDVHPELEETRENQAAKWERMYAEYLLSDAVEADGWGASGSGPWTETYETLSAADAIENDVDPESVWTNEYLDGDAEYVSDFAERVRSNA
ncbi:ABC transporter substrate-binding protein [Natrialbaceae archaeon GCM10025810]|uniref:ABC transporter substrate-binding protein n=1 Tax=Halovalidus salilacus TaxID=3075124 RepID=UPI0036101932